MLDERVAVAALGALAHETRLKAFRLLVVAGPDGLPSGAIADSLGIQATGMSFHLAALERSSLIASRRIGRNVFYAVRFERMQALLSFLTDDCCGGRPELCAAAPPAGNSLELETA